MHTATTDPPLLGLIPPVLSPSQIVFSPHPEHLPSTPAPFIINISYLASAGMESSANGSESESDYFTLAFRHLNCVVFYPFSIYTNGGRAPLHQGRAGKDHSFGESLACHC